MAFFIERAHSNENYILLESVVFLDLRLEGQILFLLHLLLLLVPFVIVPPLLLVCVFPLLHPFEDGQAGLGRIELGMQVHHAY